MSPWGWPNTFLGVICKFETSSFFYFPELSIIIILKINS